MGTSDIFIDRISFILGMITAFAECVSSECKKLAFSPPFRAQDFPLLDREAHQIASEQQVSLWYEKNEDIPQAHRLHWYVIYKFEEALDEYVQLRAQGFNPAWELDRFYPLLSYGLVWAKGVDEIIPHFREERKTQCSFSRILLNPQEWPIPKS